MEQWKELKETIMELSKLPQMVNQTELCMFLLAYMEVLEDRMRDDTYPSKKNNKKGVDKWSAP
jgi:hypothetical protein